MKISEITSFQLCECPFKINKKHEHNARVTQSLMLLPVTAETHMLYYMMLLNSRRKFQIFRTYES